MQISDMNDYHVANINTRNELSPSGEMAFTAGSQLEEDVKQYQETIVTASRIVDILLGDDIAIQTVSARGIVSSLEHLKKVLEGADNE